MYLLRFAFATLNLYMFVTIAYTAPLQASYVNDNSSLAFLIDGYYGMMFQFSIYFAYFYVNNSINANTTQCRTDENWNGTRVPPVWRLCDDNATEIIYEWRSDTPRVSFRSNVSTGAGIAYVYSSCVYPNTTPYNKNFTNK